LTNDEIHEFGALNTLLMTIVLILCFAVAYLVKKYASAQSRARIGSPGGKMHNPR
jgi:flagellar biogenesis protein FliO